jgi:hypothetical protein
VAIEVEVQDFVGAYAGLNAAPTTYGVGLPEVINKAITVGGLVRGSSKQRTYRRQAISQLVLSSVRAAGPAVPAADLVVTELYNNTEMSEKTGISYRLGMAFAAVVAGRVLRTRLLKHIPFHGQARDRRADLIGLDRRRRLHLVEAKCRTYGITSTVRREAKDQASSTRAALLASGEMIETASACLTDLSAGGSRFVFRTRPRRMMFSS